MMDDLKQTIKISEMIIKGYEKRGGGYSQCKALKTLNELAEQLLSLQTSGVLPEKAFDDGGENISEDPLEAYEEGKVAGINSTIDEQALRIVANEKKCPHCKKDLTSQAT